MVFLVISSLVVAVVIFLCGVLVGRGVRATRAGDLAAASSAVGLDPTARSEAEGSPDAIPEGAVGTPAAEDLTYTSRLESSSPLPETLREPAPPEPVRPEPSAPPPARAGIAIPSAATAIYGEPPGKGLVVQVMSVAKLSEAESVARGLKAKGYPAFVSPTGGGLFRVRLGKYPNRREAQAVADRLEKEEKFTKPWVVR